jgi:hypothetical protein
VRSWSHFARASGFSRGETLLRMKAYLAARNEQAA